MIASRELFRKKLISLMNERGINQVELAQEIGSSVSCVNQWVKGVSCPRGDLLIRLSNFFMVSPSTMIGDIATSSTDDEEMLVRSFRMLSAKGKEKAIERMHELTQLYWYDKDRIAK